MITMENFACLVLVGCIWGVTNPWMKRASVGVENIQRRNAVYQFLAEFKFLVSNWRYMVPFLINLSGSVIYFLVLGTAELSIAVPVSNSLSFIFTTITGKALGEELQGKSTYVGMLLVVIGTTLCVLSKSWHSEV